MYLIASSAENFLPENRQPVFKMPLKRTTSSITTVYFTYFFMMSYHLNPHRQDPISFPVQFHFPL